MKYPNSCIVYSILHMIWIFVENWRRPFMKSYTTREKSPKLVLHLAVGDKIYRNCLLKMPHVDARAWTTNKSRCKLIPDGGGQCQHRNRETTVQHTICHYWVEMWELHKSVYQRPRTHKINHNNFHFLRIASVSTTIKIHLKLSAFPLQKLH